ncbi:MAG: 5-dehydro-4-deoxy-D-glucuronate isomerase [Acholeplasmatales bacterium]|jgi:4-deoxy-L-threo-5-hexosulose-uronate ketol-isomerase|nr:5-dehydro-4-deoxy-D-glucuronate isomerase [Acholeplasmatales bacterium]
MKLDIRYNNHPSDVQSYDTKKLRENFLVQNIFVSDEINFTYSHHDRIIFGGIKPVKEKLVLPTTKDLGTSFFLERREMGVINIGGSGVIEIDGITYNLNTEDALYIPLGSKIVTFSSVEASNPAKFYCASSPAHAAYPVKYIPITEANPRVVGDVKTINSRTIYQYLHPNVLHTCQLSMGLTKLNVGSSWNTMPSHTHERRMEVYLYFNFPETERVFHMMGKSDETRHIVLGPEEAVISPSWSIHSGVGTTNYTFIWAMCGENLTFDDMDNIDNKDLK